MIEVIQSGKPGEDQEQEQEQDLGACLPLPLTLPLYCYRTVLQIQPIPLPLHPTVHRQWPYALTMVLRRCIRSRSGGLGGKISRHRTAQH